MLKNIYPEEIPSVSYFIDNFAEKLIIIDLKDKIQYIKPFVISSIVIILLSISSCKTTKYIPEDKYLVNKVSVKCNNNKISTDELYNLIKQKPNRRIFGFYRFHLHLYNLVNPEKEKKRDKKRKEKQEKKNKKRALKGKPPKQKFYFTDWLQDIGEAPVIYDEYKKDKSVQQLRQYLKNLGYFHVNVRDSVDLHNQKADIYFTITTNEPYTIANVEYMVDDPEIRKLIISDTLNSLLEPGNNFDVSTLQNERERISLMLKNKGYYFFSREYIHYKADTSFGKRQVILSLQVKDYIKKRNNTYTKSSHKKYRIKNVSVITDYQHKKALQDSAYFSKMDTLSYNQLDFLFKNQMDINPGILSKNIYIRPEQFFSVNNSDKTNKHLNSLNVFQIVNIEYKPVKDTGEEGGYLKCIIHLTQLNSQSYALEIEGTNTAGNIGVAGNIVYKNRNLFKGAERFEFRVKGALENQVNVIEGENKVINTYEIGPEMRLDVPQFLLPIRSERFYKKYNPRTAIMLAYNYRQRPDYTRSVSNFSYGFFWSSSKQLSHFIDLFEINSVDIPEDQMSEAFKQKINENILMKRSYTNYLITETSYGLNLNTQDVKSRSDFIFLRWNIASAGNLVSALNSVTKATNEGGKYLVLGRQYAQYIKSEIDFRYYDVLNSSNKTVYRIYAGAGIPYGNSDVLPFVKQYSSGGANGIRAWQIMSLGPGSYKDTSETIPYQTGDIKIEFNIEYRFRLFWRLEGALFADAGNIWSINKEDDRPGALFKGNQFINDLAIGSGLGARFDFSFFIFRIDWGLKIREPSNEEGNKWISGIKTISGNDHQFNIGIGYPF